MAGVSSAAVSFVINGKKGVSDSTRKKIQKIIDETGFVPDNNSRRFYFKKNFTVALVKSPSVSLFSDIFYYDVARGLDYECEALGYSVIFSGVRQESNKLILPEVIRAKDTDGLVFLQEVPKEVRNEVRDIGLPCVVVDASDLSSEFTSVYTDYKKASYSAARYLIDRGHTNIAFLGPNRAPAFYMNAFLGFKRAMEEVDSPIPSHWIQSEANDNTEACRAMDSILGKRPVPTAIVCATDLIAVAAMNYARKKGVDVPSDLSFIGIDDVMVSSFVYPSLTTVRIDKFEMGKGAMDILIKMINNETTESLLISPGAVVERDSVCIRS